MNFAALAILIVAADPRANIDVRPPGAVPIYTCDFETASDINYDQWPDRWTRHRGIGFPHYLKIEIRPEQTATGEGALRIDLDGGAAAATSPHVEASEKYGYWLEGRLWAQGLVHDEAFLSLTFLDEHQSVVRRHFSTRFRQTDGWQDVRIGPVGPNQSDVRWVVIGVHVEPSGNDADLRGLVVFDDLWLGRAPRLRVHTTANENLYTDAKSVKIEGTLTGATTEAVGVTFELFDAFGRRMLFEDRQITLHPFPTPTTDTARKPPRKQEFEGEFHWRPRIRWPGYYLVRTTIEGPDGPTHTDELSLVVVEPRATSHRGPFGWSMPRGAGEIPVADIPDLLAEVGISRLKYPLWFSEDRPEEVERLVQLVENISNRKIEVIGLLNNPPQSVRSQFENTAQPLVVSDIFARGSKLWYPSLEPVMTRFLMRTRRWQLGEDRDWSFVDHPAVAESVARVKRQLDVIGQDLQIGLPWRWDEQIPLDSKPPWSFMALSSNPVLSKDELRGYLLSGDPGSVQRWVSIEPLAKSRYTTPARVKDLVERMVAAKIGGAEGIFILDPFDPQHGLLKEDGTPGVLLLPWRTTSLLLSGATHAGQIRLPGGSTNEVFVRDGQSLMMVSNPLPQHETIALGQEARQVDVWGRSTKLASSGTNQVVEVGRFPSFVVRMNAEVSRWRQALRFREDHIPSIFGRPLSNAIILTNTFGQGVKGQLTIVPPPAWRLPRTTFEVDLPVGGSVEIPFEVTLPLKANTGPQQIEVRFKVMADHRYQFSVYPTLSVGNGDVVIETSSYLDDDGKLVVQQRAINRQDAPITLKCRLFVPGRLPLRKQIVGLSNGTDVQLYRIDDGRELIGRVLSLRAREIDGPRLLHYTVVAEP